MKNSSLERQEALAKAKELEDKLTGYDFKPFRSIYLESDTGFRGMIQSAFVLVWKDWYLILSEHHDPLVFHTTDAIVTQYESLEPSFLTVEQFEDNRKPE